MQAVKKPKSGSRLTPRESKVLGLMAQEDLDAKGVARRLNLSVKTVGSHLYNAYNKLGVDKKADALVVWKEINR
jgi:DNA-binding CsgD family transcriptional regulator